MREVGILRPLSDGILWALRFSGLEVDLRHPLIVALRHQRGNLISRIRFLRQSRVGEQGGAHEAENLTGNSARPQRQACRELRILTDLGRQMIALPIPLVQIPHIRVRIEQAVTLIHLT